MIISKTIIEKIYLMQKFGIKTTPNGAVRIGAAPHIAPLAWNNSIMPCLTEDQVVEMEQRMGCRIPEDYRYFLKHVSNGLFFMCNTLRFYGYNSSRLDRTDFENICPFSLVEKNLQMNVWKSAQRMICFGSYGYDGSLLFISQDNTIFYTDPQGIYILKTWSSLDVMINEEIDRIYSLFDEEGKKKDSVGSTCPMCVEQPAKLECRDVAGKCPKLTTLQLSKLLKAKKLPSIKISLSGYMYERLPLGSSKFGGIPSVPTGFSWPKREDGTPLAFLLQLNCSDLHTGDEVHLLPSTGFMYFFSNISAGMKDQLSAKVFYYDVPIESLHYADYPQEMPSKLLLSEVAVEMQLGDSYPDENDLCNMNVGFQYGDYDVMEKAYEKLGINSDADSGIIATMFGYPTTIQDSVINDYREEVLLLQMFSFELEMPKINLNFVDEGILYFTIPRKSYENRQFEDIHVKIESV